MTKATSEDTAKLFADWASFYLADYGGDDAACAAGCRKARAIERRLLAISPVTAADLARQVVCYTGKGDFMVEGSFRKRVGKLAGN